MFSIKVLHLKSQIVVRDYLRENEKAATPDSYIVAFLFLLLVCGFGSTWRPRTAPAGGQAGQLLSGSRGERERISDNTTSGREGHPRGGDQPIRELDT